MFNKSVNGSRGRATFASLALGLAFSVVAAPALADTGVPSQVEYFGNSSWPLRVQVNGINFLGNIPAPGGTCTATAQTVDTIKIWASLAQAAFLAGKSVTVYYVTCGASKYIYDLVLQ